MGNPFKLNIPGQIDRGTMDTCSIAGINLMSTERTKFSRLAQSLQNNIDVMKNLNSNEKFYSTAIFGATIVKATCDAFIDMAGTLAGAVGLKPVEKAAAWLGAGGKAADFAIGKSYGQKTDGVGVFTSTASALLGTDRLKGKMTETGKGLAELQLVKIDIIKEAVAGDATSVKKEVFLSYIPKIANMTLAALNREVAGNLVSAGTSLAKAGSSYSNALEKAFDEKLETNESTREREIFISTMSSQLVIVIGQIKIIDKILNDCRLGKGLSLG